MKAITTALCFALALSLGTYSVAHAEENCADKAVATCNERHPDPGTAGSAKNKRYNDCIKGQLGQQCPKSSGGMGYTSKEKASGGKKLVDNKKPGGGNTKNCADDAVAACNARHPDPGAAGTPKNQVYNNCIKLEVSQHCGPSAD